MSRKIPLVATFKTEVECRFPSTNKTMLDFCQRYSRDTHCKYDERSLAKEEEQTLRSHSTTLSPNVARVLRFLDKVCYAGKRRRNHTWRRAGPSFPEHRAFATGWHCLRHSETFYLRSNLKSTQSRLELRLRARTNRHAKGAWMVHPCTHIEVYNSLDVLPQARSWGRPNGE